MYRTWSECKNNFDLDQQLDPIGRGFSVAKVGSSFAKKALCREGACSFPVAREMKPGAESQREISEWLEGSTLFLGILPWRPKVYLLLQ